jgi:hypothetical protein
MTFKEITNEKRSYPPSQTSSRISSFEEVISSVLGKFDDLTGKEEGEKDYKEYYKKILSQTENFEMMKNDIKEDIIAEGEKISSICNSFYFFEKHSNSIQNKSFFLMEIKNRRNFSDVFSEDVKKILLLEGEIVELALEINSKFLEKNYVLRNENFSHFSVVCQKRGIFLGSLNFIEAEDYENCKRLIPHFSKIEGVIRSLSNEKRNILDHFSCLVEEIEEDIRGKEEKMVRLREKYEYLKNDFLDKKEIQISRIRGEISKKKKNFYKKIFHQLRKKKKFEEITSYFRLIKEEAANIHECDQIFFDINPVIASSIIIRDGSRYLKSEYHFRDETKLEEFDSKIQEFVSYFLDFKENSIMTLKEFQTSQNFFDSIKSLDEFFLLEELNYILELEKKFDENIRRFRINFSYHLVIISLFSIFMFLLRKIRNRNNEKFDNDVN